MKRTILLLTITCNLIACKKEDVNSGGTAPKTPTKNSDSTYVTYVINNGAPVYHYDAKGVISGFDPSALTIQSYESFPSFPDFNITGLAKKVLSGQTLVDSLGNTLRPDFLTLNMQYRLGTSDVYAMRYPTTISIDRHDTIANNIKGHFERIFERSTTDTLKITGIFNVFY